MTEDSLHPGSSCLDTSARRSSSNLLLAVALVIVCGVVFAGPSGVVIVDAQMTSPPSEEKQPPKPRSSTGNPLSGNPEAIEDGRNLYAIGCVLFHGHCADGVA